MKAMVLNGPNLPFERVERPDPVPGPGEAVARVITCGSGLTIQHIKAGRKPAAFPRFIGHEITGGVVSVGPRCCVLQGGYVLTSIYFATCRHSRQCIAHLYSVCTDT